MVMERRLGRPASQKFTGGSIHCLQASELNLMAEYAPSDQIAGRLGPIWAERFGLRAGIPVPVGALDAHWDAIGAGAGEGDVVNVIGTATCVIG
jgi:L-ribulokinase